MKTAAEQTEDQHTMEPLSELDRPVWSVISFSAVRGTSLTYQKAAELLAELESKKIAGLCIVTDSAASRLRSGSKI